MTTFYATPDNAVSTTTGYTAGSGSLALAAGTGSRFGTSFPLLLSTFLADGTPEGRYTCTGRTGDTLTGLTLVGGTDATLPNGATVAVAWADEHAQQIRAAVNALESRSGSDAFYTFTQSSPATTWTITHNLGKYPSVSVVDSAGTEVEGDVRHVSNNQLTVSFVAGFSGSAYLN